MTDKPNPTGDGSERGARAVQASELVARFRSALRDPEIRLLTHRVFATNLPSSSSNWGTDAKEAILAALSSPATQVPAEDAVRKHAVAIADRFTTTGFGEAMDELMAAQLADCIASAITEFAARPPTSAAAEGVPEGWRPIETAPKEHGRRFVAIVDGEPTIVAWSDRWERWTDLVTGRTLGPQPTLWQHPSVLAAAPPAPVQAQDAGVATLLAVIERVVSEMRTCAPAKAGDRVAWRPTINHWARELSEALSHAPAPVQAGSDDRSRLIDSIVRDVAELPDRTSPDNRPDVMLVSDCELRDILQTRLTAEPHPPADTGLRAFSASEAACYRWPDDTPEHKALRAAYIEGAAGNPPADRVREALASARLLVEEITDREGREGITDAMFAERVLALAHEHRDTIREGCAALQSPAQPNREAPARALADVMAPAQGGEGERT